MNVRFLPALIVFVTTAAIAQEQPEVTAFVCIPDFSVGYSIKSDGKWGPAEFKVEGQRYLLRFRDSKWWWTDFGADAKTQNACGSFNKLGFIDCHDFEVNVRFNRNSLRFQAVHPYGYVTSDIELEKEMRITPYYQIGRCSPF